MRSGFEAKKFLFDNHISNGLRNHGLPFVVFASLNAIGNKLSNKKIKEINLLEPLPFEPEKEKEIVEVENTKNEKEEDEHE